MTFVLGGSTLTHIRFLGKKIGLFQTWKTCNLKCGTTTFKLRGEWCRVSECVCNTIVSRLSESFQLRWDDVTSMFRLPTHPIYMFWQPSHSTSDSLHATSPNCGLPTQPTHPVLTAFSLMYVLTASPPNFWQPTRRLTQFLIAYSAYSPSSDSLQIRVCSDSPLTLKNKIHPPIHSTESQVFVILGSTSLLFVEYPKLCVHWDGWYSLNLVHQVSVMLHAYN